MTNQINGYFVFAVNECDWVVAKDADEDSWDDLTPLEQERELEDIAKLHLSNHADFGAYVSDD